MPRRVATVGIGQTKHEESKGHYVYYENDFQVAGAGLALAHGLSAPAGAAAPTNRVAILERG